MLKNKSFAIAIAVFLMIIITSSIAFVPSTSAHTPAWTVVSYPYIVAAPNPVGVGQTVAVVMWIDDPLPGATVTNDIRRHGYTLTITKPDGTTEAHTWDIISDSTGFQYYQYTPDQVGNYTFKFAYPQQTYTWTAAQGGSAVYTGDIFLAASKTITLTVQQEQIPSPIDSYPLPTNYWTYPIEGQNTYWYSIASNWLGSPYILGAAAAYGIPGAYQPYGSAPNSAHIMWTKTLQYGGVVGGNSTAIPGEMFYGGLSYNVRFSNPIIMQGSLFYQEPLGNAPGAGGLFGGTGGDYVAVDLQTGKELWRINASATGVALIPSFGYLYSFENPNQHGVLPDGLLIASTTGYPGLGTVWKGYDPRTGVLTPMTITNVPSGAAVSGPSGEYLSYALTRLGSTWYLSEWNSSQVFGGGSGLSPANWYTSGQVPANAPLTPSAPPNCYWNGSAWAPETAMVIPGFGTIYSVPAPFAAVTNAAYDWNVSLSTLQGTGWGVGMAGLGNLPMVSLGNMMLLVQGTFGGHPGDYGATVSTDPANVTAISLKPGSIGQVLWTQTYQPAAGNQTRLIVAWDPNNGVFVFADKESMTFSGYSLASGSQLWGPTVLTNDYTTDYNYAATGLENIAYGKLYYTGYSGILYCYDDKTGNLLWTYGNGGEGNSTLSGFSTPYGRYPTFISTIADGKVYLDTTEHSPNSPLYKGAELRCINATDGTEMWAIMDYGLQMYGGPSPVASGYLTTLNSYDAQIYCYGKGPSALTVTAPDIGTPLGTPIVIRGTVTDVAAGTQQNEQKANFPYGVPAVSDASMASWMEYVYMQKPMPTNVTGVPVSIDVLDSNGNYRNIGSTTSDASGMFTFTWTPDITGSYTVIATFAGSQSYYPSYAESSFAVSAAPPTAAPTAAPVSLESTQMYVLGIGIAIIIVVVIIGALIMLMLRKRP